MLSDKVDFDVNSDFEDNNNYKSCFARSVVVNSQYQHEQLKRQLQTKGSDGNRGDSFQAKTSTLFVPETNSFNRTRDCYGIDDLTSLTLGDSRRSSACSSRIAEMPVENLVLRNQIETLQWQLKQTESSKEMYRELMVQVVRFLERAYHSLNNLGSRVSTPRSVSRAQSAYLMNQTFESSTVDIRRSTVPAIDTPYDYTSFRDFTWRRQKKPDSSTEEIPPEKLSQEAFRLLRTAQSLLNTRTPDLAQVSNDTSEDIKFLEQLAKEFPRAEESTHRPQSRCSSVQLGMLEKDIRISTAYNRKLSLQQNASKRNSFHLESSVNLSEDANYFNKSLTLDGNKNRRFKLELEKSSPPMSSVSSAEDESGFSSMNSFQEIGIPLINSTVVEEDVITEELQTSNTKPAKVKDLKLWQTPATVKPQINHKRWNSTPTENTLSEKPLKVLWV